MSDDELHNHFTGHSGRCVPFVPAIYIRQIVHAMYMEKRNPESAWMKCLMSKSSITSSVYHSHRERYTGIAAGTTMIHVSPVNLRYVLVGMLCEGV